MKSELWDRLEDIFHDALQVALADREAFLTGACGGDTDLQEQVQSLISAYELPGDFLEQSQLSAGLSLYAARDSVTLAGEIIGPYILETKIGSGGMGDVYLARDKRLGRHVAFKVLPTSMGSDSEWIARFRQEARAASSISHPNIAHIYEVGEFAGRQYIAMEYIEGITLRERLRRGSVNFDEAIEITMQAARGLAAAHAVGVLHRDVKPENIMIRVDGYVKVLDFGLAKIDLESHNIRREDFVSDMNETEPGVIRGTTRYMSPEQARGVKSDARADIWSLGVAFYEMLCGEPPFTGETSSDVLAEILKSEPRRLNEEDSSLSPAIKMILRRALNKDSGSRYQSVNELLQDLKSLDPSKHVDTNGIAHSWASEQVERLSKTSTSSGALWYRSMFAGVDSRTSGRRLLSESAGSSVRALLLKIKDPRKISRRRTLAALAVACLITTGLGVAIYQLRGRNKHRTPPGMKITKVSNGGAWVPTISPDGKYVAYVANSGNGELGVWIKEVATGYATQLLAPAGVNYAAPYFSRDGRHLYYSIQNMNNMSEYFLGDVYRIPIVGGASRKILSSVCIGLTLSPNGKQMAFIRAVPSRQAHDLIISNDDGADERVIATRHWPEISWVPTWSPDGRLIAFGARNRDGDSFYNTVMAVPVEGGPEQPLTSHRWLDVGGELWLGDGSGLLVTGKEQLTDPMQIYVISHPSGAVRPVTNDTSSYSALQITADSRTLIAEVADVTSNIRVVSDGDASRTRQITTGGKDGLGGLGWTPDGKIVYASLSRDSYNSSAASGNHAIWMINSDGNNPRQLTADNGNDTNPVVTPDGRQVVFASHRAGAWGIWRAEMDTGNSTLLASGGTTTFPVCSPNGQWVYFRRLGSAGRPSIWRVSTGGGEPMEMTKEHAYYPAVSPDGNWVAFFSPSETKIRLLVIPSTGGAPVKTFDVAPETDYLLFSEIVRWTPDGRYLTYIRNQGDTSNIWRQPFAGGAPNQQTNFDAERIFSFDWSPDGKQLAVARGQYNRQIVLLSDFR